MRNIGRKMTVFMHRTLSMAAAAVLVLLSPATAQPAQLGTHVGMLTCQMALRNGLTVGPVQSIRCHFIPDGGYSQQAYMGQLATVGPDVGITTGGVLAWDVLASTGGSPAGDLAGVYVGAHGDVRWVLAWAPICFSEARIGPSPCSRSPSRAGSKLPLGWVYPV
jgi:hypothetical protein